MVERLTRQQQRQRTRERLLDAAESLFSDRGIHQTSLDEVAATAGLTKGAIYSNFAGKRELIGAILERRLSCDKPAEGDRSASVWGLARDLGAGYESGMEQPEARRFALALMEFWLYGMRDESARSMLAQWMSTVRERNRDEILARAGDDLPLPAEQLTALMTALDVGVALQYFIDKEAVPASVYTVGLEIILGSRSHNG